MKMPSRRYLWAGAAILLAVLALPKLGLFDSRGGRETGGRAAATDRMTVRAYIVRPEVLEERVSSVGTLLAREEIVIRSEIAGKIERILFREGARVARGQPLVKLNDDELQAQYRRAEVRLELALEQEERQRLLYEKALTSKEANDQAVANRKVARSERDLILAQLQKTEIQAPFAGIAGLRAVSEGSSITPATVIATLQDNSEIRIDFSVPEKYAARIRQGQEITFTVQGRAERYKAKVYAVEPRIDETTRSLRVRANRTNKDGSLIPGAFASVAILLRTENALTVPSYTVIPELKGHKVFVARGGRVAEVPVSIGVRAEDDVEITAGLSPGDTLIASGLLQVRQGMPVSVEVAERARRVTELADGGRTDL